MISSCSLAFTAEYIEAALRRNLHRIGCPSAELLINGVTCSPNCEAASPDTVIEMRSNEESAREEEGQADRAARADPSCRQDCASCSLRATAWYFATPARRPGGRMLHSHIGVVFVSLLAATGARAVEPTRIVQSGGNGAVNVAGNGNFVNVSVVNDEKNYAVDPDKLAILIGARLRKDMLRADADRQGLEKKVRELDQALRDRTSALQKKNEELQELLRADAGCQSLENRVRELDQAFRALQKKNEELLSDNELKLAVIKELERAAALQEQIRTLSGEESQRATAELNAGNFDAARAVIDTERAAKNDYTRAGLVLLTSSDWSGGLAGFSAGLHLDGFYAIPFAVGRVASLLLAGSAEVVFGEASIEGGRSFFMMWAVLMGPRFRLGAPNSAYLEAGYYFPFFVVQRSVVRFPLVGVGAKLGGQIGPVNMGAVFRYSFTSLLYASEPNMLFVGLAASVELEELRRWTR